MVDIKIVQRWQTTQNPGFMGVPLCQVFFTQSDPVFLTLWVNGKYPKFSIFLCPEGNHPPKNYQISEQGGWGLEVGGQEFKPYQDFSSILSEHLWGIIYLQKTQFQKKQGIFRKNNAFSRPPTLFQKFCLSKVWLGGESVEVSTRSWVLVSFMASLRGHDLVKMNYIQNPEIHIFLKHWLSKGFQPRESVILVEGLGFCIKECKLNFQIIPHGLLHNQRPVQPCPTLSSPPLLWGARVRTVMLLLFLSIFLGYIKSAIYSDLCIITSNILCLMF